MSQDYADWLTPARLEVEEQMWASVKAYKRYAATLHRLLAEQEHEPLPILGVVELGGGTGWVPTELDGAGILHYQLVDRYPGCLALAREKNQSRPWVQVVDREMRDVAPITDLVCSFGVLKHFSLAELPGLFVQWFSGARFGLFTIPIATEAHEDAYAFTHTWVSEALLAKMVAAAGHVELWRETTDALEPIIATRRR